MRDLGVEKVETIKKVDKIEIKHLDSMEGDKLENCVLNIERPLELSGVQAGKSSKRNKGGKGRKLMVTQAIEDVDMQVLYNATGLDLIERDGDSTMSSASKMSYELPMARAGPLMVSKLDYTSY